VVSKPDEIHADRFRSGVKHFPKHLEELSCKLLCVVAVGDEVVAAYLINREKYSKYKARRWA
jgi:hypothetical protein